MISLTLTPHLLLLLLLIIPAFATRPLITEDDLAILIEQVGPELARTEAEHTPLDIRAFYGSTDYSPSFTDCPDGSLIRRSTEGLSSQEHAYLDGRENITRDALISLLDRIDLEDFSASEFIGSNTSIRVGLAFSGGGYRAMLQGAGVLAAVDNRTTNATDSGHIGGLLQASTYVAGLSGGAWLLSSYVLNNFTSIEQILATPDLWNLTRSMLAAPVSFSSNSKYYDSIFEDVESKYDAGFNVSIVDFYGRLLSYQFFNYTDGGIGLVWSDIADSDPFKSYQVPFPIVHGLAVNQHEAYTINTTSVLEFNPYEMGSWDTDVATFINIKYIGSDVVNGTPSDSSQCVTGFDQAGFIIGTSSNIFGTSPLNSSIVQAAFLPSAIESSISDLNSNSSLRNVAIYSPNPFYDVDDNIYSEGSILTAIDGGIDGQNVPLTSLLLEERGVDVIFAVDVSADSDYTWPTGSSLGLTYDRQFLGNSPAMPYVPDQNTFVNLGLVKQPTFFGCDITNSTSDTTPLIVYLANYPYTYLTNTSTVNLAYDTSEIEGFITNGYNLATQGNGTVESEWSACVACAIIHREVERRGLSHTDQCQSCMDKHCWDGTVDDSEPSEELYTPDYIIGANEYVAESSSSASASSHHSSTASAHSSSALSSSHASGAFATATGGSGSSSALQTSSSASASPTASASASGSGSGSASTSASASATSSTSGANHVNNYGGFVILAVILTSIFVSL
ncbi:phospholipase B [Myxozyma melibiosi]|uniref:Lysophospholipase n=1 Tax=Myxozyma melibiosi TaxID=54550 RepID=A0ABR1EZP9_9ASCO